MYIHEGALILFDDERLLPDEHVGAKGRRPVAKVHVMIAPSAPAVTSSPVGRNSTAVTAPSCARSV
jgi:hypothetical protein